MSEDFSIQDISSAPAAGVATGADSRERNRDRRSPVARVGVADVARLSPEAQKTLQKLQQRDRDVRAHEQAHIAAGGGRAGGASFTCQNGPDGRQYAVGGSVPIDVSPVPNDPEATEEKARVVRRAALAPANPSAADQSVAAKASAMEARARSEKSGRAASAYARTASPAFGASWQSSAGAGRRDPASNLNTPPWPGPERAAAVYAAAYADALPQTGLAPWGTGISMTV